MDDVVTEPPAVVPEEVVTEEVVPSVISINELVSLREALLQKEQTDRTAIVSVFSPSTDTLREKLFTWAVTGFSPMFTLLSTQITTPSICSDNTQRELLPYIEFLLGSQTLDSMIQTLEQRVDGIKFSYNVVQLNVLCLTVIKQ